MPIFKWDKKVSLVGRQKQKKKPKKEPKTAEENALERRQRSALDDEIEESEEKFSALRRGRLGSQSLLTGAPRNAREAATKASGASSGATSSGLGIGRGGLATKTKPRAQSK